MGTFVWARRRLNGPKRRCSARVVIDYDAGATILEVDEVGHTMYIVEYGQAEVVVHGDVVRRRAPSLHADATGCLRSVCQKIRQRIEGDPAPHA